MAPPTTKMALACKISRGGFSDERVFQIQLAKDEIHSGVVSRRFLWGSNGQPIAEGEPPLDEVVKGKIAVMVLQYDPSKKAALVSIPDGSSITVGVKMLLDRPSEVRVHVPV